MLTSIILGLLRHALTAAGGALVAHSLQFVEGLPVVHDVITAIAGGALVAAGSALSALQKVKVKSGADYSGLNK